MLHVVGICKEVSIISQIARAIVDLKMTEIKLCGDFESLGAL